MAHTIETTKQNLEEAYRVEFEQVDCFLVAFVNESPMYFRVDQTGALHPDDASKLHEKQSENEKEFFVK